MSEASKVPAAELPAADVEYLSLVAYTAFVKCLPVGAMVAWMAGGVLPGFRVVTKELLPQVVRVLRARGWTVEPPKTKDPVYGTSRVVATGV